MIFQTTVFLWFILVAAAIRYRSVPAAIFIACALLHQVLCGGIDGPRYYVTAAAFDAFAVVLLARYCCVVSRRLAFIAVISSVVNFFGLIVFTNPYFETMVPYRLAAMVLYCAAIAVVMGGASSVEGLATRRPEFRFNFRNRRQRLSEKQT
jgi:hypothetical protein